MRTLMPSIVDPRLCRGGGWAATRGLMSVLELAFPDSAIECVPLKARNRLQHRVRQATSTAKALVDNSVPSKIRFATDDELRSIVVRKLKDETPDLVIINGTDLSWLLTYVPESIPTILIAHNIEHELYASQIESASRRFPAIRRILERDLQVLKTLEMNAMQSVDGVIFVSASDRETALESCPALNAITVPPVFDYDPAPRNTIATDSLQLGMFADFTWWPNREALAWFLDSVWPGVTSNVELRLFGYGNESSARGVDRVRSFGFIDEPTDAFGQCDIMIAPAVSGAGVKVKVAEALYNRVPVVASPLALRGFDRDLVGAVHMCSTPTDWIEFLSSDAARTLAHTIVPDDVAMTFSASTLAGPAGDFIESLLPSGRHDLRAQATK